MRPSRVAEVLDQLSRNRWPAFLWGAPGVGKSSIVRAVAAGRKMKVTDIRAALLDPTDLRGIPVVEGGVAKWCPPSFLPTEKDPVGILFFDELNSAPPLVQASLYQLTLDRRVGEYQLPDGWWIVAAGNRAEDSSITYRMPAALSNRFIHVDFEVDYDDWRDWAVRKRIDPLVIAFLGLRRELLFDMRSAERAFPTPRSWEMASDTLRGFTSPEAAADVLLGIVGESASVEFLAFARDSSVAQVVAAVLADPESAALPEKLNELYALVSVLISRANETSVRKAAGVIVHRLSPELAVLLINDTLKVAPSFSTNAHVREFIRQHSELIAPS